MSHAGFNRKTRYATLALVIGANLPDADLITRLSGSSAYLKYHRGITHSILGVTVLAVLLFAFIRFLRGKAAPAKSGPEIDARWLFLACWTATASHLLLDFTNFYGVRPFLPFSGRWYAWDIMSIFDPLLTALLLAGFGVPALFRLVSEEVGAKKPGFRRGAIFSLISMLLLWGVRDFAHRRVLNMLDSHAYHEENPRRLAAFPSPGNPFAWTGVVETDSAFSVLAADALDNDVDAEHPQVFHKPEPSPVLDAALRTPTAGIFSNFARFLWPEVEETDDGYNVSLRDLRFVSSAPSRRGFVVNIELDKNLCVRSEGFSFTGSRRSMER